MLNIYYDISPEVIEAFEDILLLQHNISEAQIALLEQFVVIQHECERCKKTTTYPLVKKHVEFVT